MRPASLAVLLMLMGPVAKALLATHGVVSGRLALRATRNRLLWRRRTTSTRAASPEGYNRKGYDEGYTWPRGNVLAVGEGDFTFSALLVAHARARGDLCDEAGSDRARTPGADRLLRLLATTLDAAADLPCLYPGSAEAALAELKAAAASLPRGAVAVAFGVDATKLEASPEVSLFACLISQPAPSTQHCADSRWPRNPPLHLAPLALMHFFFHNIFASRLAGRSQGAL